MPLKEPTSLNTEVLKGATIVLKEINTLYHKTVVIDLDENPGFNESDTEIAFHGIKGSCKTRSDERYKYLSDKNISKVTPEYALKGSNFTYTIIVGNQSMVDVCLYRGPDYDTGVRVNCKMEVLSNGRSGKFRVPEAGYYYFKIKSGVGDFELSISEKLNLPNYVSINDYLNCSINTTNDNCTLSLPLGIKYCLTAVYLPTKDALPEVKLKVSINDGRYLLMIIPTVTFIMVMIVSIICACIFCCCC